MSIHQGGVHLLAAASQTGFVGSVLLHHRPQVLNVPNSQLHTDVSAILIVPRRHICVQAARASCSHQLSAPLGGLIRHLLWPTAACKVVWGEHTAHVGMLVLYEAPGTADLLHIFQLARAVPPLPTHSHALERRHLLSPM